MNKVYRKFGKEKVLTVFLMVVMLFAAMIGFMRPSPRVGASTIIGYQVLTLEDGETAYTDATNYTGGYLSGSFGDIVLQLNNDISGTATITITPQFSNDGLSCGSASDWADATISGVNVTSGASTTTSTITNTANTVLTNTLYTTSTVVIATTASADSAAFSVDTVLVTLAGDGSTMLRLNTMGRCFRAKMVSTTTFTPSLFAWFANTTQ